VLGALVLLGAAACLLAVTLVESRLITLIGAVPCLIFAAAAAAELLYMGA
jgi:hypothetical protein